MYRVLKSVLIKTPDRYIGKDFPEGSHIHRVKWEELGIAESMEDANRKFPRGRKHGYSLVLEEVQIH